MSGNDSRVFYTQPLPKEETTSLETDINEKDNEPKDNEIVSRKQHIPFIPKSIYNVFKPPKDLVRTDSRQQKLDKFISSSRTQNFENKNDTTMCDNSTITQSSLGEQDKGV